MRAAAGDRQADTFPEQVGKDLSDSVEKRENSWPGAARGTRAARLSCEGVGTAFGGFAAARSPPVAPGELRVSRTLVCRAGRPAAEQEQLVVSMHRSFRELLAADPVLGPAHHTGCRASGNNGDRNSREQGRGGGAGRG